MGRNTNTESDLNEDVDQFVYAEVCPRIEYCYSLGDSSRLRLSVRQASLIRRASWPRRKISEGRPEEEPFFGAPRDQASLSEFTDQNDNLAAN
jgi:hypothetical protein